MDQIPKPASVINMHGLEPNQWRATSLGTNNPMLVWINHLRGGVGGNGGRGGIAGESRWGSSNKS